MKDIFYSILSLTNNGRMYVPMYVFNIQTDAHDLIPKVAASSRFFFEPTLLTSTLYTHFYTIHSLLHYTLTCTRYLK